MEVNGVISGITSIDQTQTPSPTEQAPQDQPQTSEPTEQQDNESTEIPGVIRNLLEGHFKGVSDVRLHINHFEALQAIEQEQLQAVIEDDAATLESIALNLAQLLNYTEEPTAPQETSEDIASANVQAPADSEGLTQDQQDSADNASEKVNELLTFENQSKDTLLTLVTDLQSTLTGLADSLNPPLPSTINETLQTPVVPLDDGEPQIPGAEAAQGQEGQGETPPVDSPSAFEILVSDFIEQLNSVFLIALDELTESLSQVEVFTELSEPNGNGSAYDKFLTIYNDLLATGESNNESPGLDSTI